MNRMNLDWNAIRPLNGSRDRGFEELCAQLANAERPEGSEFVRKGTPDAGVECYAILNHGSEWAWQAKYFNTLGKSQWEQIDRSVKKALEKHPRLARYHICIPFDRPDARLKGRKSAKERWNEHVKAWCRLASKKGMTVDFVYWGSHELLERLTQPNHAGRVRFWFGMPVFDEPWLRARLDEAVNSAGPRYTREIHVDLPIAEEFEAFGRTDRFFGSEKARAQKIRKQLRTVERLTAEYSEGNSGRIVKSEISTVSSSVQTVLTALSAIQTQATGPLPFRAILGQIDSALETASQVSQSLHEHEQVQEGKPTTKTDRPSYQGSPVRQLRFLLSDLISVLHATRSSLAHSESIASRALLLIRGDAGTGKTHLLCDIAQQRLATGRPTVLLMGQRFVTAEEPWSQALKQLDLARLSAEEFVGALEAAAQTADSRALLMIDALNEGSGRTIGQLTSRPS